ncbi:MAG: VOC family protein [Pseudomonadota bacterium]|nr:VOC family protein [Pseudomonadota bacterium]
MSHGTSGPRIEADHLVIASRTLEEGAAWCEATFGVRPEPGGRHALMATHNLLLAVGSARYPRTFLEIIAIDPAAPLPRGRRWFDLDAPALQQALQLGPTLVHWVARTNDIEAGARLLRDAAHDPGAPTLVERMTPRGLLRWRITLRADGRRPADGAVPLLIEWGAEHPCDGLEDRGVRLERLEVAGVPAELAAVLGVDPVQPGAAAAPLTAILTTPGGRIALASPARFIA